MANAKRNYKAKDVEMLTVARTIVETAQAHLTELVVNRPTWANPYFPNIKARIDNAFTNFLGIDPKRDQRTATAAVIAIFTPAKKDLALFKTEIEADFKNNKPRRDELLNLLGFKSYLKQVQKGDQEALINLLYQFKTNMTTAIQTEIVNAGTSATFITTIKGYADTLKNANITQETFKSSTKDVSAAGVKEFNEIYDQIIGVAKISAKRYVDNPTLKVQFSFSKLVKQLNSRGAGQSETVPPVVPGP